jgi:hypothetical protein
MKLMEFSPSHYFILGPNVCRILFSPSDQTGRRN